MKSWLKNAIFYEIYPQSFKDSNADGIGDLNGIIEKLDYIKELGFTAIWMNPCFESPFRDGGYDITDFYKVASRYGTNEDLKKLCDEVHKRDMHIILDLVAGHTSTECEWFQKSMQLEKNEYTGRYIWNDYVARGFEGVTNIKGELRGICQRNAGVAVNYFSCQPALNYGFAEITADWQCSVDSEDAVSTREELFNIIRFWLGLGCDGFRVDMAHSLVKNDPDEKETTKLWQKIFKVINKEFPDAAFVSEWGDPEKALAGGFDMDFLLPFGPSHYADMYHSEKPYFSPDGAGDATAFFAHYTQCIEKTKGKGFMCLPSGNHDLQRLSYYCNETEIKLVYAFMMSMPGIPFVYYGDEIGMKYLADIASKEGGYHRTGARTPMQWNNMTNCGFSAAKQDMLYLAQDPDEDRPTVEGCMANENSILNEMKHQIEVRKATEALQEGAGFELISAGYPLVYRRYSESENILVAINPKNEEMELKIDNITPGDTIYSFNGTAVVSNGKLKVPAMSASYIKI